MEVVTREKRSVHIFRSFEVNSRSYSLKRIGKNVQNGFSAVGFPFSDRLLKIEDGLAMVLMLNVIKADIGFIGGHNEKAGDTR